jgi:hypothetical protein
VSAHSPDIRSSEALGTPNDITSEYVGACADERNPLASAFDELRLPPAYDGAYRGLRLNRPLFAKHGEISSFGDDLKRLFTLVASLPDRCFDGDVARYCVALGMESSLADVMRLGATGHLEPYGRADAYHDGTSFKLLEFNIGSELGGIDAAQMNRAFLEVPAFAELATRVGLGYVDTMAVLSADLHRAAGPVTSTGEPAVALLEGPGALREHQGVFDAIQEAMRAHGIDLLLGEVQQLTVRNGKLVLDGRPLDVVLRYFTAAQLIDQPSGREVLTLMVKAHAEQKTSLYTPLEAGLLESKANLALLHDPDVRDRLTAEEVHLVDRVVPWTRQIGTRTHNAPADSAELLERCRARRDSLIIKPGTGWGGVGALLGSELTDREWSDALWSVRNQDYVVQDLVRPAAEPVFNATTGRVEAWQANWGVFATDQGYAGAFVRALRAEDGAVISYSNRETRGTCVFTYPAPAPTHVGGLTSLTPA